MRAVERKLDCLIELMNKYKPYKGFYDLRNYNLPKKLFLALWDIQDMLSHMSEKEDYFKEFLPRQWEDAKEVSAKYQQVLFRYKDLTDSYEKPN